MKQWVWWNFIRILNVAHVVYHSSLPKKQHLLGSGKGADVPRSWLTGRRNLGNHPQKMVGKTSNWSWLAGFLNHEPYETVWLWLFGVDVVWKPSLGFVGSVCKKDSAVETWTIILSTWNLWSCALVHVSCLFASIYRYGMSSRGWRASILGGG